MCNVQGTGLDLVVRPRALYSLAIAFCGHYAVEVPISLKRHHIPTDLGARGPHNPMEMAPLSQGYEAP